MGIVVGLLLTALFYMAFPLIKLATNGKKIEKRLARKIALWNSVVVGILFLILAIATETTSTWNAIPAILYYCINYAIIADKNSSDKTEKESSKIPSSQNSSAPQEIRDQEIKEKSSIQFCRKCGNRIISNSVFCNKCGTKLDWN